MSRHGRRRESSSPTSATALLNSAGGIVKALPELGREPFYILNADTFWIDSGEPNLERLALAWDAARMDILLMLADLDSATGHSGGTDFLVGADGGLRRATATRRADLCRRGDRPSRHLRRRAGRAAFAQPLFRPGDRAGRLFGMRMRGRWITVGTPDAIPLAEAAVAARPGRGAMSGPRSPRVLSIPPGAPFLPTLADALLTGRLVPDFRVDGDPLALADVTIYVPTRRAARELRSRLRRALGGRPFGDPADHPPARRIRRGRGAPSTPTTPARSTWRRRSPRIDRLLLLAPLVRAWKRAAGPCRRNVRGGDRGAGLRSRCDLAGARPRGADGRDRDRRLGLDAARRARARQPFRLVAGDARFPAHRHRRTGRNSWTSAASPIRPRIAMR